MRITVVGGVVARATGDAAAAPRTRSGQQRLNGSPVERRERCRRPVRMPKAPRRRRHPNTHPVDVVATGCAARMRTIRCRSPRDDTTAGAGSERRSGRRRAASVVRQAAYALAEPVAATAISSQATSRSRSSWRPSHHTAGCQPATTRTSRWTSCVTSSRRCTWAHSWMTTRSRSASLRFVRSAGAMAMTGDPHPNTAAVRMSVESTSRVRRPLALTLIQCGSRSRTSPGHSRHCLLARRSAVAAAASRAA